MQTSFVTLMSASKTNVLNKNICINLLGVHMERILNAPSEPQKALEKGVGTGKSWQKLIQADKGLK